jgi:hypothetical protein
MTSVICYTTPSILSDHHSEPVAFDEVRPLSLKQPEPQEILMNERDDESSDDELCDDESAGDDLLSVKDILEDVLTNKPDVCQTLPQGLRASGGEQGLIG